MIQFQLYMYYYHDYYVAVGVTDLTKDAETYISYVNISTQQYGNYLLLI